MCYHQFVSGEGMPYTALPAEVCSTGALSSGRARVQPYLYSSAPVLMLRERLSVHVRAYVCVALDDFGEISP